MQTIKQLLKAGPGQRFGISGKVFFLQSADQGNNVTVRFDSGNSEVYEVEGVGQSFKASPVNGFTGVTLTVPVDTNVVFIITDGDVDLQFLQSTVTIGNGNGNPVPVSLQTAATFTASNVAINNPPANPIPTLTVQASTVTDSAPVAVPAFNVSAPNQVHIRAAGACRVLRITNPETSSGMLFVGGPGVTPTNAAIRLSPGDMAIETDVPQLDWYATSDSGATANVQVIA
ncbi:hypothetical protein [Burkholderia sp. IMCC1007]|uniref:hypothetical protein n=1 Tax=Burkholderia sp. IMCC1007 TaxID=3004104 RepID=UPI0022B48247|nr:hypothetical protein [Burkholderia sp. IMCC1007]